MKEHFYDYFRVSLLSAKGFLRLSRTFCKGRVGKGKLYAVHASLKWNFFKDMTALIQNLLIQKI